MKALGVHIWDLFKRVARKLTQPRSLGGKMSRLKRLVNTGKEKEQCAADVGECGKVSVLRTGVTWEAPCGGRRVRWSHLSLDSV